MHKKEDTFTLHWHVARKIIHKIKHSTIVKYSMHSMSQLKYKYSELHKIGKRSHILNDFCAKLLNVKLQFMYVLHFF